jgi:hypothetical protein
MNVNRTIPTLILAALMIAAAGELRPPEPESGVPTDIFWARKANLEPEYDLVICGDSRVLVGVSPEAMKETLGNLRIVNFAFNSQGYSASYLESARSLLDPQGDKILLLGITPYSLTPQALQSNMFKAMRNLHPAESYQRLQWGGILDFFRPYSWRSLKGLLLPAAPGVHQTYYEDGWVASDLEPPDPRLQLKTFRRTFADNHVSDEVITSLTDQIREWRREGVLVFGFRPPTTAEMEQLERDLGGFEVDAVVEAIETAGGIWINLNGKGYISYDGSHMTEASAMRLSRELGELIADRLRDRR